MCCPLIVFVNSLARRHSPLCSLEEIMEDLDGIDEFHMWLGRRFFSALLIYQFCIRIIIHVSYFLHRSIAARSCIRELSVSSGACYALKEKWISRSD